MLHTKALMDTTSDHLGLGVDVGRAALQSVYVPMEKLTEPRLCDWIAGALVGQSIQYHEGFLLLDRSESASTLATAERARLHSLARRAWIACEMGLVHLFSLKVAPCHYRYIAVRSSSVLTRSEIRTRLPKAAAVLAPTPVSH